mmetsp:Transcript_37876/g.48817  ORF Transcript_37876/g.48817 Transcript_37876/m.48817 type:complete len:290 (+) Transcript_37876:78-947(+)
MRQSYSYTYNGHSHHEKDDVGIIASSQSLEATVLQERAADLRKQATKLARQRAFLREERQKARRDAEYVASLAEEMEFRQRSDWFPEAHLPGPEVPRVKLNVGGQVFEVTETVLKRDEESFLASLCDREVPEGEILFIDRDWWIFRYLIQFLRDGILPDDSTTLSQLYKEAKFWKTKSLMKAIEEIHLNLKRTEFEDTEPWWKDLPDWWASKEPKEEEEEEEESDWWTDTEYKGKKFGDFLSTDPNKVVADDVDDEDAVPMLKSTWHCPTESSLNYCGSDPPYYTKYYK